jgi:hypothetical protein
MDVDGDTHLHHAGESSEASSIEELHEGLGRRVDIGLAVIGIRLVAGSVERRTPGTDAQRDADHR